MRAFRSEPGGTVSAKMDAAEAGMLANLAAQLIELLGDHGAGDDPALLRLLPDAYPDDAEASSEFRRFTADGLTERKIANATTLIDSLADVAAGRAKKVRLDPQLVQAWLRSLTDLRLTIAARLGIERDDDEPADEPLSELYNWLGFVQGSLIEAVDAA